MSARFPLSGDRIDQHPEDLHEGFSKVLSVNTEKLTKSIILYTLKKYRTGTLSLYKQLYV